MQQVLTFIPIGLKLQSDSKSFRPYAYCGLGIAALFNTDHVIRNSLDAGSRTVLLMSLSLNAGVGIAGRIGSQYLLFEVTPTLNGAGIFTNLGYSF